MKNTILVILLLGTISPGFLGAQDLEVKLFELPDLIFEKLETPADALPLYKIMIKQPIDHNNPATGYFYQKAYLTHVGFDRPTVMVTQGYSLNRNRPYELSTLLEANQINIEHRYFGESIPTDMDYKYLNLKQACADLHHINELFREVYTEQWISTGISKGGSTTIFYRYFYPEDVDVSVPYVAPINIDFEEPRIYQFLDTIGSDDCRADILAFQKRVLKKRDDILPLLKYYSLGAGLEFNYLSLEEAFEFAVLEYPFSFWQYGASCSDIPDEKASLDEHLEYLLNISGVTFFADASIKAYGSHYYQSATEMGYYGYETDDFKGLLKALPMKPYPHAAFIPDKMEFTFNGDLLDRVNDWLPKQANEFIYINGAIDTWSASAVPTTENIDALWFFMEGKHHANARIANMGKDDQLMLVEALERWLGMDVNEEILEK